MGKSRLGGWRDLSSDCFCGCLDGQEMKFSKETKEIIKNRANERCEICGSYAIAQQIHHRRPRGMGGSKDPLCGSPANGVLVHPWCHASIEQNRTQAIEKGWLVSQGHDPSFVPFKKYFAWVLLKHDGTQSICERPDA
jgi:5-methylcytosine-specific restriction protein A